MPGWCRDTLRCQECARSLEEKPDGKGAEEAVLGCERLHAQSVYPCKAELRQSVCLPFVVDVTQAGVHLASSLEASIFLEERLAMKGALKTSLRRCDDARRQVSATSSAKN